MKNCKFKSENTTQMAKKSKTPYTANCTRCESQKPHSTAQSRHKEMIVLSKKRGGLEGKRIKPVQLGLRKLSN